MLNDRIKKAPRVNQLFAMNCDALMQSQDISQSRLAKIIGIHQPQLGRWLSGDTDPGLQQVCRVADALGVEPHELLLPIDAKAKRERSVNVKNIKLKIREAAQRLIKEIEDEHCIK